MEDLFHDADVARARASGGIVALNQGRCLRLPRTFGFCGGVANALKQLQQAVAQSGGRPVWLLGEIIHNDTVNQAFRALGVRIIPEERLDTIFSQASPDDLIVIPAFGIPESLQQSLEAFVSPNGAILDTTCGYVRRIWTFVEEQAAGGRTILIHGKPNHPETRAILSRALSQANAAMILPDLPHARMAGDMIAANAPGDFPTELLHHPDKLNLCQLAMVNQTTMLYSETKQIETILQDATQAAGGQLTCSNTVCRATQMRQDAAIELCRQGGDLFLVVGGFASSNTNQLYRLAHQYAPTYFIRDAEAVAADRIRHYVPEQGREIDRANWCPSGARAIGVLAGASCPPSVIGDLIRKLRQL